MEVIIFESTSLILHTNIKILIMILYIIQLYYTTINNIYVNNTIRTIFTRTNIMLLLNDIFFLLFACSQLCDLLNTI